MAKGMVIEERRLYRSQDACLGGVCSGIAECLDLDAIVVRILAILLTCSTLGIAAIIYLVLWLNLPLEPEGPLVFDVRPEQAESNIYGRVDCESGKASSSARRLQKGDLPIGGRLTVAVGLTLLFLAIAMNLSPMMSGTTWWEFWPVGFMICGLCLIIVPIRSRSEMTWHAFGIVIMSLSAVSLPMSLHVLAWSTFSNAMSYLWPLVLLGVALMGVGSLRATNAPLVIGAFCITLFCVLSIYLFAVPGDLGTLSFLTPSGDVLVIAGSA